MRKVGCKAGKLRRCCRVLDHRGVVFHPERVIVQPRGELHLRLLALVVGDLSGSVGKCIAICLHDLLDKLAVLATRLSRDAHVIGDDVRRLTGALAVLAAEAADVGGALLAVLHDLAEPAFLLHVRQRQCCRDGRRDALLRMHPGVARLAGDLHLPALGADGADTQLGGQSAVDVEAHDRVAQRVWIDVAGTPQAALLANGEQQRQRRVGQLMLQQGSRQRHQAGDPGTVVAAQCRRAFRDDALALAHRHRAGTQRHRIEVGGEEQPRTGASARQRHDQVTRLRRQGDTFLAPS